MRVYTDREIYEFNESELEIKEPYVRLVTSGSETKMSMYGIPGDHQYFAGLVIPFLVVSNSNIRLNPQCSNIYYDREGFNNVIDLLKSEYENKSLEDLI
mgnify:FL=1